MTKPAFSTTPWYSIVLRRILVLMPLKAIGTTTFMALFFWGYFSVLEHPLGAPFEMPLTPLDSWIAFNPAAYPVYVSLWVYVSLPPALIGNLRALLLFGAWIAALCLFCLGIFWLFPTSVPVFAIDWSAYPALDTIKGLDAGGNACPSLHVASAVFAALWLERLLGQVAAPVWLRWGSFLHCLLILWSTLATRQHVVWDVLAGLAVGLLFGALSLWHITRRNPL